MKKFTVLAITLFLLAGCANLNSIYRTGHLMDKGHFIDAKQRVIYSTTAITTDDKIKKVCAEPSPDVLSAIAAGFEKSSGTVGAEISESVAQISRIATTELIRERLYRACEAYFNGALDNTTYEYMQADFILTSSALLAIDRLGAGLDCKTRKLASAKANVDSEDDPDPQGNEGKDGNQDLGYDCSHLNDESIGHITEAMQNIVEKVHDFSVGYQIRIFSQERERNKQEEKLLSTTIENQRIKQELMEKQFKDQQERSRQQFDAELKAKQEEQERLRQQFDAELKAKQEEQERLRQQLIEKQ